MQAFQTDEALRMAVAELRSLPAGAKRVLAMCVEHQELIRTSISPSIYMLEDYGFVRVRDESDMFQRRFLVLPTLAGEEALEELEKQL